MALLLLGHQRLSVVSSTGIDGIQHRAVCSTDHLLSISLKRVRGLAWPILGGWGPSDPGSNPGGPTSILLRRSHRLDLVTMRQ